MTANIETSESRMCPISIALVGAILFCRASLKKAIKASLVVEFHLA